MKLDEFKPDNYFKIDVECHIFPEQDRSGDYFLTRHKAPYRIFDILGINKLEEYNELRRQMREPWVADPELTIELMNKYDIDMACVLRENMMVTSLWAYPMSTNHYVFKACEKYPDRFIFQANVGPVLRRGIKNTIWEVEYLVKERNCKIVKMYYPEEEVRPNDPELFPFYGKLSELGVVMTAHTGVSWGHYIGRSKYCRPMDFDDLAHEFPELKIICFHAGWPYTREMNMVAANHYNIYVGINLLCPWGVTMPWRFAEIIGELKQMVGVKRMVWGTDYFGKHAEIPLRLSVEGLRDFKVPEELQDRYGLPEITEDDKRRIFGLNLAELLGIEPRRRVPSK